MKRSFLAGTAILLLLPFLGGCMMSRANSGSPGYGDRGRSPVSDKGVSGGTYVRCYPLPPENLKSCYIWKDGTLVDEKITSGSF